MLSISQFSKIACITTKTLRYYDEIELFKPSYINDENGYRYYEAKQLKTIFLIQKLKEYELSLGEIKTVLDNDIDLLTILMQKKAVFDKKITKYLLLNSTIEKDISNLIKGGYSMFNDIEYSIEVVDTSRCNVVAIRRIINVENFTELLKEVYSIIEKEGLIPIGPPMTFHHGLEYTPENYDMEVAIPVQEDRKVTKVIPVTKCAKLTYKGVYDDIPKLYAHLAQWIEEHNYELNAAPFEIYLTDPFVTKPEENELEIYYPIIEKE